MESTGLTVLGGRKDFWFPGRAVAWKPPGYLPDIPGRSVRLAGDLGDG